MIKSLKVKSKKQGLIELTNEVQKMVNEQEKTEGLCTLFVRHTSCSLIIQENADLSAKHDLENWLNRLVPENDPLYTHIHEGADDMPSHIKSVLTATSLSIPFEGNKLLIGTWQGIYLWEHRKAAHTREIVLHMS